MQELQRAHDTLSFAAFLYAIIGAIGTMLVAIFLSTAESWKPLFHRYVRMGITEYAAAISIVIFIGMPHVGELASLDRMTLQTSRSFRPTSPDRSVFFVKFWELPVAWIFASMIPGLIITILFFFDHEVSSIICTIDRYGTKKPTGFAWDIVLLGATTAVCGILGIPPANGLIPQAPLHSESLMHIEKEEVVLIDGLEEKTQMREVKQVYEQRWSAFIHASAILIFVSPPLQRVLGLTPTSVLAGLFMFMGEQSLAVKYALPSPVTNIFINFWMKSRPVSIFLHLDSSKRTATIAERCKGLQGHSRIYSNADHRDSHYLHCDVNERSSSLPCHHHRSCANPDILDE